MQQLHSFFDSLAKKVERIKTTIDDTEIMQQNRKGGK